MAFPAMLEHSALDAMRAGLVEEGTGVGEPQAGAASEAEVGAMPTFLWRVVVVVGSLLHPYLLLSYLLLLLLLVSTPLGPTAPAPTTAVAAAATGGGDG